MENIILVGIMGCGKTTISKLLSEKLKMPVIDMDILKRNINVPFLKCLISPKNISEIEKVKLV